MRVRAFRLGGAHTQVLPGGSVSAIVEAGTWLVEAECADASVSHRRPFADMTPNGWL
jgi:hypothetical protein